ncbi:MAG: hypothetical protein KC419_11205 [Anaerolineales bacterium]|nr:hypothetical protein [Anaerolineales bacterium]
MATEINGPRLRALLRQADRVAESGKRAAAIQLYKEILAEAPDMEGAWIGLAEVEIDPAEKEKALQQALAINPNSVAAKKGLAKLWGEVLPNSEAVPETAVSNPTPQNEHQHAPVQAAETDEAFDLVCYRHPDRETALRCYNCNKPICSQCAVKTPVGYICPDCIREKEDIFFNSKPTDYVIAPLIALPLSLLAGYLVTFLGGGFFGYIIVFFAGGLIGGFIGRIAKRAVGHRRGRYLPHVIGATVILGAAVPAIPILLAIVFGNPGALIALLLPGIYAFVATGAAFYQMK